MFEVNMPIVGGYTLALYCENSSFSEFSVYKDLGGHKYNEFPHEFITETGSHARALARKRGWKLDLKTRQAFCPECVKKGLAN
jgi:hypothetical protein